MFDFCLDLWRNVLTLWIFALNRPAKAGG